MYNIPDHRFFHIVFLIESKYKSHDGKLFSSFRDAKLFCAEAIQEHMADKYVIGTVNIGPGSESNICLIETYGFKNDKKSFEQLDMFKDHK